MTTANVTSASLASSTSTSLKTVLGTVTTAAATLSSGINSVGYLAASAEIKAKLFHARVHEDAVRSHFRYLKRDAVRTVDAIVEQQQEIAKKLSDPVYAALYAAAEQELATFVASYKS